MEKINESSEHLKQYINNRIASLKLQFADKASSAIASSFTYLCIAAITILSVLLLSIGIAILINGALNSIYAGYLIMALFYLVLAIVLKLFSEKLIRIPILNRILQQLFEDEKD